MDEYLKNKEINRIEIRYNNGSMITIDKQTLDTLDKASEAIELLNRAKETARRFLNMSEQREI